MIHISVPFFPPSVNHAYFTKMAKPRGNPRAPAVPLRVMTKEGRAYKREFKTWLAREHQEVLQFFSDKEGEFSILVVLYFNGLYNSGWPKTKTRHKKIDASNYLKVLEDALVEACGHDDSQHITITAVKDQVANGEEPWFELYAWNAKEEDGPIYAFLNDTRGVRHYPR